MATFGNTGRPSSSRGNNAIGRLIKKHAINKENKAGIKARKKANSAAEQENQLVTALHNVDFINSRLPAEVLEKKLMPEDTVCAQEYRVRQAIQDIEAGPAVIGDTKRIDEKLTIIVDKYATAVNSGFVIAAEKANAILVIGIADIRRCIPVGNANKEEENYIETACKYLDSCITLIDWAMAADSLALDIEAQKLTLDGTEEQHEQMISDFKKEILDDPKISEIYLKISKHNTPEQRDLWGKEEKELHLRMVDLRLLEAKLDLERTIVHQREREYSVCIDHIDTLSFSLDRGVYAKNGNLLNLYREEIDRIFEEIAQKEIEFNEAMELVDAIEDRLDQVYEGAGFQKEREVAAEMAERIGEEIKKMQTSGSIEETQKHIERIHQMGFLTEEEEEAVKAEAEVQKQALYEEIGEVNFN